MNLSGLFNIHRFRAGDGTLSPVFIFAACWRTGSTLLQRIVIASSQVFVWGEPRFLPQAQAMYARMVAIAERPGQSIHKPGDVPPGAWIPTICPDREQMRQSFAGMFVDLYGREAYNAGFRRWGFKEVRGGAVEAAKFLHELFPRGRFLFLIRNPLDTYQSVRNKKFFSQFSEPYAPVDIWSRNAGDFLDVLESRSLPAILIRYEDLVGTGEQRDAVLAKLCGHLQINRTPAMDRELALRTGGSEQRVVLSTEDVAAVRQRTESVAHEFGYEL